MSDEVPQGWIGCTLGDVVRVQNGYAFPSNEFQEAGVPLIRQSNLDGNRVSLGKCAYLDPKWLKTKPDFILRKNDVLIGMSGSVGKLCIYDLAEPALQNQRTGKIVPLSTEFVDRRFVWQYLKTVERRLVKKGKGMGVVNVSGRDIESLPFRLAPLNEQRRIVAKLGNLLRRVDASQARLDHLPRILKRFRQSVLAAACSGKLTVDWQPELVDSVQSTNGTVHQLKDIARFIDYRGKTPQKTTNGIPLITAKNVRGGYLSLKPKEYIAPEDYKPWMTRGIPKTGDVLITTEAPLGNVVCVDWTFKFALAQRVICLQFDQAVVCGKYASLVMQSPDFQRELLSEATGSMVTGIKAARLKELSIALPTLQEQQEIVRRVEALFKTADALEARYRKAKAHVDKLTQSILAKAFRGELVPQDPEDEPAAVLLERVRSQREPKPGNKSKWNEEA